MIKAVYLKGKHVPSTINCLAGRASKRKCSLSGLGGTDKMQEQKNSLVCNAIPTDIKKKQFIFQFHIKILRCSNTKDKSIKTPFKAF